MIFNKKRLNHENTLFGDWCKYHGNQLYFGSCHEGSNNNYCTPSNCPILKRAKSGKGW
jgi:hypothetical protein